MTQQTGIVQPVAVRFFRHGGQLQAKAPAMPERIEAVDSFVSWLAKSYDLLGEPRGPRGTKEIAMSQDRNHLNQTTWECKYHVTPKYLAARPAVEPRTPTQEL
jgi:hypothetical protein